MEKLVIRYNLRNGWVGGQLHPEFQRVDWGGDVEDENPTEDSDNEGSEQQLHNECA